MINPIGNIKEMKKIESVFLDMDGVIYDSMPYHAKSWQQAFAENGINYPLIESYINEGRKGDGVIKIAFKNQYNRLPTQEEIVKIYDRKTQIMSALPPPICFEGTRDFIFYLKEKNIKIIVVTGSKQPSLIERLSTDFGISTMEIVSGQDVDNEKPHPEPYLKAINKSGSLPNNCIVIENAPLGIISAKKAGLHTIAVKTGLIENADLIKAGADKVLNDTIELIKAFETLR